MFGSHQDEDKHIGGGHQASNRRKAPPQSRGTSDYSQGTDKQEQGYGRRLYDTACKQSKRGYGESLYKPDTYESLWNLAQAK